MRPDPILALKKQLGEEILRSVSTLNVSIAAVVLGIGAPRLADLRHGRVARFSVERLIRILAVVDRRVTVTVTNEGSEEIRWFRVLKARRDATSGSEARV